MVVVLGTSGVKVKSLMMTDVSGASKSVASGEPPAANTHILNTTFSKLGTGTLLVISV